MTRPRSHNSRSLVPISLMVLAILAVVAFQFYWLRKNYQDEQRTLRLSTNVLFRETVQRLQIEKLKLDTNLRIRVSEPGAVGVAGVRGYGSFTYRDSTSFPRKRQMGSVIVSLNKTFRTFRMDSAYGRGDSVHVENRLPSPDRMRHSSDRIVQLLRGVDAVQDSLRVKEVTARYKQTLQSVKINTPFLVHRDTSKVEEDLPEVEDNNRVTLGFSKPYTMELELQNTVTYVLKRLTSQILVSVLLVSLTAFSFIVLYRNFHRQRKLTQLKNDFISNITHELKTPIATVSVAIEALRNFNALQDPQRTKEYLDISASELQRLSLLVDKVLKLSMFEKQQIELKGESFDLKQLVEEVVGSMRLQFEKYRAKVSIQLHGNDFMVRADRLHITSVVYNLLDNALKYSKANPAIQIDLASLPLTLEMSITDNGIGISPEYQKKIFDKFFRVPTGDTHNVKGYGLGLAYVAYIIHRHKGFIEVESQPGIGTRLTTKIPKNT
jgi:two-component system phosphate regulon sensor histidine kinase PhoR